MAYIETHIQDTQIILRQPDGCEEVHIWLDEFAKKYPPHIHLEYHRKFRHNRKGLEEIKKLFGVIGQEAGNIQPYRELDERVKEIKARLNELPATEEMKVLNQCMKSVIQN